jgi:opacity protein-like surface antigen
MSKCLKSCFFSAALILATSLHAAAEAKSSADTNAPVIPKEMSTREEALKENSSIDEKAYKKTIQASSAQQANVGSFLKLEDPSPELRNRSWLYNFAFKLQGFTPLGVGQVSDTSLNLQSYGSTVMPSIEFGFLKTAMQNDAWTWNTGLAAHAGYTSQKTNLVTPSGYSFDDARLNSGLISAVWTNRINNFNASNWSALVSPEYGIINYTQTASNNSLANFSQQNEYWGLALGAEYALSKKWGVLSQYSFRQASAAKREFSDLQNNNFEIGTSVVW